MLSKKGEQRSFGNGRLRDQWEKRAQTIAEQCEQEGRLREKSSLKLLYSKWNYHWALAANGDTSKGQTSDFHGVASEEGEKNKPKIKFKIVPPPPPPPKNKAPARPPARAPPQPLLLKRKVQVDVFRLHWKDSWMSLKAPKYLFLKADEAKNKIRGFTRIDVVIRDDKYKPAQRASRPECTSALDWRPSWKQVKVATPSPCSGRKQFQWDILLDRDAVPKPEIQIYQLPVWAGTWKIMNFAFRQEKQKWDGGWPAFQRPFPDKVDDARKPPEQDAPPGWGESWRLSKASVGARDRSWLELTLERAEINQVLLPGWNASWTIAAAAREEGEDHETIWSSCWPFGLQLRWRMSSLQSHQRHSDLMTRRRKILNWFLTSELHRADVDPAEWRDSWRTRERGNPAEEDNAAEVSELLTDTEEEEDEGVRDDEGSEDDKEEDEGVDEEEEEEAQDAQLEYNREDVQPKTETPNGELSEIEPEEDDPEDEDEEKQESDEDDQELEEDVETRETKLLNTHMDLRNRDEDEDGDSGVTDDEKEERGNAVREAREYENVSLQLKEIFRMMTNKREKDQEETDEGKDRAAAKRRDGRSWTDREDGDQAAYLQEEEEGRAQGGEDQIEEEEEEEENRWGGGRVEDDLEEKDLTRHIEEGSLGQDQRAEEVAALNKEDDANREQQNKSGKSIARKAKAPLHLRFHKANAALSSWTRSWMVAVAHRRSDGEDEAERARGGHEELKAWRESWRMRYRGKPREDEEASFSAVHRRVKGLVDRDHRLLETKWTLSWKMTNRREDAK